MWLFGGRKDAGMELFIGNLPGNTPPDDIEMLLGDLVADTTLRFSQKRFMDGSCHNFCVVSFDSRKRAEKAIRAIRHKKLGGEYLVIHEYNHRTYHNEQRLTPYSSLTTEEIEGDRRHGERRRREKSTFQVQSQPNKSALNNLNSG